MASDIARDDEREAMGRALAAGAAMRRRTPPNPWVGAVVRTVDGREFVGATEPPGGRHAEIVALDAARAAGADPAGATAVVTLEPCCHHGRTPPCTDALVAAGVGRVVIALADPDPLVGGGGLAALREAGVDVEVGLRADEAAASLRPYLHHRRTGRPFVVLKLAATLDGRTAAADGSSRWITGAEARAEVHRLRAESDAVLVGRGTILADDPELTVRTGAGPDPQRVVLGSVPADAKVRPCWELHGDLGAALDELGRRGVLQLLVEGGPTVASSFHRARLVDRYVVHLAPALMGGDDGRPVLTGPGAATIDDAWRGRMVSARPVGEDLEIVLEPVGDRVADHPPPALDRRGGVDVRAQ
jgi:diaminohydroxyphosphoribosylaminopyrimidine deaminase/5-amino-6-(5-phosphoribosylamino)uracil reductase